jgi:hypothetical protein
MSTGSKMALLIGLPIGTVFSLGVLVLSLFPMLDLFIVIGGGGVVWNPLVWGLVIPVTFTFLLWKAGGNIEGHFTKKYSTLKVSFLFTLFVNSWLFLLFAIIFLFGLVYYGFGEHQSFLDLFIGGLKTIFISYLVMTLCTTFSIGLVIVAVVEKKLKASSKQ